MTGGREGGDGWAGRPSPPRRAPARPGQRVRLLLADVGSEKGVSGGNEELGRSRWRGCSSRGAAAGGWGSAEGQGLAGSWQGWGSAGTRGAERAFPTQ